MATHSWTQHMRPELQLLPFRIDPLSRPANKELAVIKNENRTWDIGHFKWDSHTAWPMGDGPIQDMVSCQSADTPLGAGGTAQTG